MVGVVWVVGWLGGDVGVSGVLFGCLLGILS